MTTLSTHDTKRSADVRARLALLSEIPDAWEDACGRWIAASSRHWPGGEADRHTQHLLFQTLVGAWPLHGRAGGRLPREGHPRGEAAHVVDVARPRLRRGARRLRGRRVRRPGAARRRGCVRRPARRARARHRAGPGAAAAHVARACPTPTRAPSCGTSAWSTPTTAAPSTSRLRRDAADQGRLDVARRSARRARRPRRSGWAEAAARARGAAPAPAAGLRCSAPGEAGAYAPLAFAGRAAAHAVGFTRGRGGARRRQRQRRGERGPAVAVVVPRLVLGLDAGGGWADTTVRLPPGRWTDLLTGASWDVPATDAAGAAVPARRPARRLPRRPAGTLVVTRGNGFRPEEGEAMGSLT